MLSGCSRRASVLLRRLAAALEAASCAQLIACANFASRRRETYGEVAEWFIALVSKTSGPRGLVGSNPTLSAKG